MMTKTVMDLSPGDQFLYQEGRYVLVDPRCDFAIGLPKPAVVELGTGNIVWFGADNEVEKVLTLGVDIEL